MASYTREGTRQPTPDRMHPFAWPITVAHPMDIPSGCRCVWVPRPDGFGLPVPRGTPYLDGRQPWRGAGLAMKFRDAGCPVTHRLG